MKYIAHLFINGKKFDVAELKDYHPVDIKIPVMLPLRCFEEKPGQLNTSPIFVFEYRRRISSTKRQLVYYYSLKEIV